MCTKLRSGVLVGLPPGHRRQAVKCPRAPFSWKPSAESEKKSAMCVAETSRLSGIASLVRYHPWHGERESGKERYRKTPIG